MHSFTPRMKQQDLTQAPTSASVDKINEKQLAPSQQAREDVGKNGFQLDPSQDQ
jgi:hypothetical protein